MSTPTSLWCYCSYALKWNARKVYKKPYELTSFPCSFFSASTRWDLRIKLWNLLGCDRLTPKGRVCISLKFNNRANLKRSLMSTVRPPSTLFCMSRKRSFSKTLFEPEKFKNAGFLFSCGRSFFTKRWRHDHVISLTECDWWLLQFKFIWRCVYGKHLMRFQNETSVSFQFPPAYTVYCRTPNQQPTVLVI